MDEGHHVTIWRYNFDMDQWMKTNLDKDTYKWNIGPKPWVLCFKYTTDAIVFKLKFSV